MQLNPAIAEIRANMFGKMADYLERCAEDENDPAPYTQAEIDACAAIVDTYIAALRNMPVPADASAIMKEVERGVLALNAFDELGNGLIETEQREQLCDIFLMAARDAGLEADEDITEEWRDW